MSRYKLRRMMMGTAAAAALTLASPALARWGVGNGGDTLSLAFASAKEHAAHITLRLNERALSPSVPADVKTWLLANRDALAADITASQHVWTLDAQETCAWTHTTAAAAIQLSYPTCRDGMDLATGDVHTAIPTVEAVGQLLVHESVHHFGITDESFANGVALAVYDAWRSGGSDWLPVATGHGLPAAKSRHSAVWTGRTMIVFGGLTDGGVATNTGFSYDPAQDSWVAISTRGAPVRYEQQAVWTGSKMIVWGGYVRDVNGSAVWQNSGAIYDPAADSWQALATPYGPSSLTDLASDDRAVQTLVWTGREAIVFGGSLVANKLTGGAYNPDTKVWRALPVTGAPLRIAGHSAVWADDRMIVFGGRDLARNLSNKGAAYFPDRNVWADLPILNAPKERDAHTAVWTGSKMIVFGGSDSLPTVIGTGAIFDVRANTWTPFQSESAQARFGHSAVWTGSEMLVYGGQAKRFINTFSAVSAFNPSSKSWRVVEVASAPASRVYQSSVFTGSQMIVFGGTLDGGAAAANGGVFFP